MNVLKLFKPAPHKAEIADPEKLHSEYKYWRLRTFYAMYIGYALYYFTRKSFTFAMPSLHMELGLSKFELGLLGTVLSLSYGASKFMSGILGDKSNPRYFMSVGLLLTGIFNLLFGFSSSMIAFTCFWGLNGFFQGWGWPGCAKLLTHWYSQKERGKWWSLWSTSHNIGGTLIPILVAFCADHWGWRSAMYVPGITCILMAFFLMNRLRDTPQSLGLPPIEQYRDDYPGAKVQEKEISVRQILFDYVLRNKFIWILAGAQLFNGFIRTAVNDWSMLYLIEIKHYSVMDAGLCVCLFEVGGFVGMLAAGFASDKIFQGRRNPINAIFTAMIIGVLYLFQSMIAPWPFMDASLLFAFGFAIFGPQMLIGLAAAELSHKKAAATATGFAGCFAYLGAALAGGPLGALVKAQGWGSYFESLLVSAALGTLIILPLWNVKVRSEEVLPPTPQDSQVAVE